MGGPYWQGRKRTHSALSVYLFEVISQVQCRERSWDRRREYLGSNSFEGWSKELKSLLRSWVWVTAKLKVNFQWLKSGRTEGDGNQPSWVDICQEISSAKAEEASMGKKKNRMNVENKPWRESNLWIELKCWVSLLGLAASTVVVLYLVTIVNVLPCEVSREDSWLPC